MSVIMAGIALLLVGILGAFLSRPEKRRDVSSDSHPR